MPSNSGGENLRYSQAESAIIFRFETRRSDGGGEDGEGSEGRHRAVYWIHSSHSSLVNTELECYHPAAAFPSDLFRSAPVALRSQKVVVRGNISPQPVTTS